ncbi:MAG: ATP-binding cassette domain-containing protein [Cyanobacteriota bacterium]|nr:ATP-binding cassette domain-containing protein [Cyanobacteriota bacterium]
MDFPSRLTAVPIALQTEHLHLYYQNKQVVKDVTLAIPSLGITAFIGPSGCGKSSILRCFNRLNDGIPGFRLEGSVSYLHHDLYHPQTHPVEVRRRIGMVFQKPTPLPKSIFDNVAYGLRVTGFRGSIAEGVEARLRQVALWDEVKDKLGASGLALSGGQQQRLCLARALAVEPQVILLDEPCAALDPVATAKIEELLRQLRHHYTIVMVTHNMQQAARLADQTAFFDVEFTASGERWGYLAEYDQTSVIFGDPQQPATQAYVAGGIH